MNRRAECAINSMATADFCANWRRMMAIGDVAIQDLTPKFFAQFKAEWGKEAGGDALWDKIIAYSMQQMREPGCFVAGTLVHTKEGLRPIEQIKVGDLVLSKPESGEGAQSYQPVTKTFSYENRELYLLPMTELDRVTKKPLRYETQYVALSGTHPIWVEYFHQLTTQLDHEPIITPVNAWLTVEEYYLKVWQAMEDWYEKETIPPKVYAVLANGSAVVIKTGKPPALPGRQ